MFRKAVALLSGGLDSMLAVRTVLDQGIPVLAVRFITPFGCGTGACSRDVEPLAKAWGPLGLTVRPSHMGQDYIDMVKKPRHGWGKNLNPCIDCRIMMIAWAKELVDRGEAGFIVTGEVINQRPMSQTRESLRLIDRAAKAEGIVLRPLSAKLLPPTLPETEGVVDRERLLMLSGRGRHPQYALAARYGIAEIPQPAGGCLLTEPGYCVRLRDLWKHDPNAHVRDIYLLMTGRHFRPTPVCKIVVGRNERENGDLEAQSGPGDTLVSLKDHQGPMTLIRGHHGPAEIRLAAGLTVRYGDVPGKTPAEVIVNRQGEEPSTIVAECAREEEYLPLRVWIPEAAVAGTQAR